MDKYKDQDQDQEKDNQSINSTDRGGVEETSSSFEDNRPEVLAQQELQSTMDSSLQSQEAEDYGDIMNGGGKKKKVNKTGIPDDLKTKIEQEFEYSLDQVRVHYNSDKPAEYNALAYVEGFDVYIAPGQEEELEHELRHVVQQMKGEVTANTEINGKGLNDQDHLELKAGKSNKIKDEESNKPLRDEGINASNKVVQRKIKDPESDAFYTTENLPPALNDFIVNKILDEVFWLRGIPQIPIQNYINDIADRKPKWTVHQAVVAISKVLREQFPMPPTETTNVGMWGMTAEEFDWYILRNFKTFSKAVLDESVEYSGLSGIDKERTHSEINALGQMEGYIEREGWDEEQTKKHSMTLWINNSPCFYEAGCAQNISGWKHLRFFKDFTIKFLNPYGNTSVGQDGKSEFEKSASVLKTAGIKLEVIQIAELPEMSAGAKEAIQAKIIAAERALQAL